MLKKQSPRLSQSMMPNAAKAASLLRVLAHPQRLCLLCHLLEGPRTVGQLVGLCGLPQPQVSQFLTRLKLEGLVAAERQGRMQIYRVADARAALVIEALTRLYCPSQVSAHAPKNQTQRKSMS